MKKPIFIIADDLTGANDTAVQFVNNGLKSIVIPRVVDGIGSFASSYDVISLNTDSRAMEKAQAKETLKEVVEGLPDGYIYKKIDSLLRGNPAFETEVVKEIKGYSSAFIIPSYPANNRSIEHGYLYAGKVSFNAVEYLEKRVGHSIGLIPLSIIHQGSDAILSYVEDLQKKGTSLFLADAVTAHDLEVLVDTLNTDGNLLAGSAGIAGVLSNDLKTSREPDPFNVHGEKVLAVVGSIADITRQQMRNVKESLNPDIVALDVETFINDPAAAEKKALAELETKKGRLVVLCLSSISNENINPLHFSMSEKELSSNIAAALGRITYSFISRNSVASILATGGDTAIAVTDALKVKGLEPIDEIVPGIPVLRMIGSQFNEILLVTKSGSFGNFSTLSVILRYLLRI